MAVCEVLIVPDVIVVVALDVSCVLLAGVLHLASSRTLEPFLGLGEHTLPEDSFARVSFDPGDVQKFFLVRFVDEG